MSTVKLTDSQRRWLEGMLWRGALDGAIAPEQARLIAGQFETEEQSRDRTSAATAFGLAVMAMPLLTLGVAFVVHSEFLVTLPLLRNAIYLGAVAGVQTLAWWLRFRSRVRVSELCLWLGSLLFAAQFLTSLDLNSTTSLQNLLRGDRVFIVGLLPLAICAESVLIQLLLALALALMTYFELMSNSNVFVLADGLHAVPLFVLPGLWWGYRHRSALVVGAYVSVGVLWCLTELIRSNVTSSLLFAVIWLGAMLLLFAELHAARDPLTVAYRLPGLMLVGAMLNYLSLKSVWTQLTPDTSAELVTGYIMSQALAISAFGILFGVIVRQCWWRRRVGQNDRELVHGIVRRLWYPTTLIVSLLVMTVWHASSLNSLELWVVPVEMANVATLATAIYLLDIGIRENVGWLVAGSGVCLCKLAFSTIVNGNDVNDSIFADGFGVGLILGMFALILLGTAVGWRWLKPGARESFVDPAPRPLLGPSWFEALLGWGDRHQTLMLGCALAFQVLAMAGLIAINDPWLWILAGIPNAVRLGLF